MAQRSNDMNDGAMININTASEDELAAVFQGVGEDAAAEIIRFRDENEGGFKSVDDLENIPGLNGKLTDDVKRRLTV